jgi:endonuclease/exonuclease/phosphatase family metal-dependent hydrolase
VATAAAGAAGLATSSAPRPESQGTRWRRGALVAEHDPAAGAVVIAWWNIRSFTVKREPDYGAMVTSLRRLHASVCGIAELKDPNAATRLALDLGPTWTADWTEQVGRTANSSEFYGWVWDTSRLDMVGRPKIDTDPEKRFDRTPGWATFRTTSGNLDFTTILTHITWGDEGVEPRKAEIRALAGVWQRVQTATVGDDDLILLGDFNRNVGDDSYSALLGIAGKVCAPAVQRPPSGPTVVQGRSTYDQAFLSTIATHEWVHDFRVFAFDKELFPGRKLRPTNPISDHRPVAITLVEGDRDDD